MTGITTSTVGALHDKLVLGRTRDGARKMVRRAGA